MMDVLLDHDRLILVDAIVSGAHPGTIHVLPENEARQTAHLSGTHQGDLSTTLDLGRQLFGDRMPREVVVVAVEAGNLTRFSEELTPEVASAVPRAVQRVLAILA